MIVEQRFNVGAQPLVNFGIHLNLGVRALRDVHDRRIDQSPQAWILVQLKYAKVDVFPVQGVVKHFK